MEDTLKHTILIVDDNPDDLELARIALARIDRKVRVETAQRGEIALERLWNEQELPALILLDLKMPGMSGFDFLRKIRADERTKNIPVIVVTSSSLETDSQKAYESGADGFLLKAFSMDQFSRDLKPLLERWLKLS